MNKTILLIIVSVFLSLPLFTVAQDARFSQYFNNPIVLNPALAGNGIEYIRVTAIYRTQWAGMGTPFTTQGFAVDKVVNRVGLGAAITRNGAGDIGIRTMNIVGNLSYNLPIGSEKINVLSAGLQIGIVNKNFDQSRLSFDSQYNPDGGYDPNVSSNETFTGTSVTRPDVNIGLSWQRGWLKKEIRFKPFFGMSMSHINRPDETFIVDNNKAPIKNTIYGGAGYQINERTEVRPSMMLLHQGEFKETTFGTLVAYQLDNKNAVQLGAYHRAHDAVFAYVGYQMNLLFVGMSYDVNTSALSNSGKGTNAFELSLTYSPRPKKVKEPKKQEPIIKKAEDLSYMEIASATVAQINLQVPETLENRELTSVAKEITKAPEQNTIKENIPVAIETITKAPEQNEYKETSPAVKETITKETTVPEILKVTPIVVEKPVAVFNDFDKDGIEDSIDECPYIKGGAATKGCPDSDNDGVIDMQDDCPMEFGTLANKGCPVIDKSVKKEKPQLIKKFNNILFATGSLRMTTDDRFDIIERAIDVMYADKNTEVILSGHTDAEGDEFHNMELSQARADVVKTYMIKQGIDESRIKTVAYGETMPLENNNTLDGKKMNRRVEINILRKQK